MKRLCVILLPLLLLVSSCGRSRPIPAEPITTEASPEEAAAALLDGLTAFRFTLGNGPYSFAGRWFEKEIDGAPHHVTLNNGSELYFAVWGTEAIEVRFTPLSASAASYIFAVSIDGGEPVRQPITEPRVALPDAGAHVVRVTTDEMPGEDRYQSELGFAFREVDPFGGRLIGVRPVGRTILFLGDSITEGICAISRSESSATHSYARYCAEALGAVPINAGFAGSGYTVSGSFAPCLTAVDFFSASRPCPDEPAPDVILLEHGQNDGGGCEVTRRCGEVLDRLAEKYPSARLFVLIPFTQISAAEIRAACEGRENVTVIETNNGWFVSTTDGVHPTAKGAYRAGTRLARELIDRLGEDFFFP